MHHLDQFLPHEELVAPYLAADVMVVTPLRDSMALVAEEYLAARTDDSGALVFTERIGTAADFVGAHLVNPYDIDGLKEILVRTVHATPDEQRARIAAMCHQLRAHGVDRWADTFLTALAAAHR